MKQIKRYLGYAIAALAMCFGSFAYAASDPVQYGHVLKHVVADLGQYGGLSAQYTAEQTYMHAERMCSSVSVAGLIRDSHGLIQVSADEVAKGMTGSTVSLFLS